MVISERNLQKKNSDLYLNYGPRKSRLHTDRRSNRYMDGRTFTSKTTHLILKKYDRGDLLDKQNLVLHQYLPFIINCKALLNEYIRKLTVLYYLFIRIINLGRAESISDMSTIHLLKGKENTYYWGNLVQFLTREYNPPTLIKFKTKMTTSVSREAL